MSIILPRNAVAVSIPGPVGKLDCLRLNPLDTIRGVAVIFHPDPKGGGSYTNKIVQTIAKVLNNKGYICYCPNLRGVGKSDGEHDYGVGEVADAVAIHEYVMQHHSNLPVILAGFSFGCAIASALANQVAHDKLILVAPAVSRYEVYVPEVRKTIVIHGEDDDVIYLADILAWAKQHGQHIIWCPETGHFFHGKLVQLALILGQLEIPIL